MWRTRDHHGDHRAQSRLVGISNCNSHSLQDRLPSSLSNTVGRGFVARLLAARLRAAPPLSNPRTLTACKSARIQ